MKNDNGPFNHFGTHLSYEDSDSNRQWNSNQERKYGGDDCSVHEWQGAVLIFDRIPVAAKEELRAKCMPGKRGSGHQFTHDQTQNHEHTNAHLRSSRAESPVQRTLRRSVQQRTVRISGSDPGDRMWAQHGRGPKPVLVRHD